MTDNFNLAKFLRNNQLLNESIGGYKDIEPMREENQIDYADYGVDPEDPDADTIVSFMQTMRDFDNVKDPSFIDNFKSWWNQVKSNREFNKKFKDSPFKMNEADNDISWDDFDRPEVEKYDRMMDLAHEEFMGISDIVSMTIDSLRHGGFNDQDILNFLATDFSLDEGLDEAEMYSVDFGTNTQDFELDREAGVLRGLKPQVGLPGSSPREEDIIDVDIDDEGYLSTSDPRVKDISPKSNANPFSDPGYMNRD